MFCRNRAEVYHSLKHWPWRTYQVEAEHVSQLARDLDSQGLVGSARKRDADKLARLAERVIKALEIDAWSSRWASSLEDEIDAGVRAFANERR